MGLRCAKSEIPLASSFQGGENSSWAWVVFMARLRNDGKIGETDPVEQLYDLVSQTSLLFGEMIKNVLVAQDNQTSNPSKKKPSAKAEGAVFLRYGGTSRH